MCSRSAACVPPIAPSGCFALAHDVMVLGHNMLDYTFADAPVDWIEQGTWMETTRWSCAPAVVVPRRLEPRRCRALA